ncbi:iron complex outermembrane receptor protein [Sphingobium xanthum]|uniref:TonB-dependent receptor n=1 Tax=Sphingobium xanthum TaxID=1387165 RepID=UPI001C8C6387|nr:TonB-dependent receptor [Sphingobium xanthum]
MVRRSILSTSALAAAFLFHLPASAQDAQPIPQDDPLTVPQADGFAGAGDIVVTARRRAETAQSVPLAISVLGAAQIESTGNFNINKLQQLTPTLQVYSSNPRNTFVNIRGIGAPFGLTSDGFEQGVGIYVDDVYNARIAAATFDFLDVSQVEILRGPQGTLYGKNTTGGAINITSNAPTFDFEGKAEVTFGNLAFKQGKAAISGPLSDRVAVRFGVATTTRRGTIFNVKTDRTINEQDNLGFRGQILFRATDDLSLTLAGDYSQQNPECCGTVFVRTGLTQRALNRQYDALAAAQNYVVVSRNPYDRLTDIDASLQAGNKIGGVSLKAKWDIGPGTLTSITAWRFWDWKPENDRDFTGLPIVSKSQNPSQQDQYSQEFRYNYSGKQFHFVVGAFAFNQRIDTQGTEAQGAAASRWNLTGALAADPSVLNGLTARNTQWLKSTSLALFGQLSWKINDALTIQPGVRLNYDKKSGFYRRRVYNGAGVEISCFNPAPTAGTVLAAQCGVYSPQTSAPSVSDWNFSYDFNVNYKIARDVLVYATYAKSFKTVGINQNGLPTDAQGNPIASAGTIMPENVNHFEVGIKTQFLDRRATFNVSAFRTDIKDFQANVNNGQLGVLRGYLANAGKVRTQGIEADFNFKPNDRFVAYVNGAYTDARYVRFVDAPCPPELSGGTTVTGTQVLSAPGVPGALSPQNCDISGQRLPGVSEWAWSWGAEANVPVNLLAHDGELYAGVDGNYRSNFSSNPSPSAYSWIKGYALTNFRAGFRTDSIDIYGWVRNAFDVEYLEQLQLAPSNVGLVAGTVGDPRTFGGTIKFNF